MDPELREDLVFTQDPWKNDRIAKGELRADEVPFRMGGWASHGDGGTDSGPWNQGSDSDPRGGRQNDRGKFHGGPKQFFGVPLASSEPGDLCSWQNSELLQSELDLHRKTVAEVERDWDRPFDWVPVGLKQNPDWEWDPALGPRKQDITLQDFEVLRNPFGAYRDERNRSRRGPSIEPVRMVGAEAEGPAQANGAGRAETGDVGPSAPVGEEGSRPGRAERFRLSGSNSQTRSDNGSRTEGRGVGTDGGLQDLLRLMILSQQEAQTRHAELNEKLIQSIVNRGQHDTDSKLKLNESLKKIGLTSAEQLLRDFEEFEAQLQRCDVDTWKRWYEYFSKA